MAEYIDGVEYINGVEVKKPASNYRQIGIARNTLLKVAYVQLRTLIDENYQYNDVESIGMPQDNVYDSACVEILTKRYNQRLESDLKKFGYHVYNIRATKNQKLIYCFRIDYEVLRRYFEHIPISMDEFNSSIQE
jgi:hypothetical protein